MIFTHEYTIYLLQVSRQFISFRAFGPSGNKLPGHLQQINLYIHLQKSRYCVFEHVWESGGKGHRVWWGGGWLRQGPAWGPRKQNDLQTDTTKNIAFLQLLL